MRDRKYRAWIAEIGHMLHSEEFEKLGDFFNEIYPLKRDEDALMDYTGLQDSKGVDIYEGAIIESEQLIGYGTIKGKVFWDERGFWKVEEIHPVHYDREYLCELVGPKWPNRTTVIGNLYQHPELINPQPQGK